MDVCFGFSTFFPLEGEGGRGATALLVSFQHPCLLLNSPSPLHTAASLFPAMLSLSLSVYLSDESITALREEGGGIPLKVSL